MESCGGVRKLSADSLEYFQDWLQLILRKAKRSTQNDARDMEKSI
jgi:hypothetical protein